jgi:hypothetical protein
MMMTEMDIETSVYNVHLTRLIAREDFIKFTRRESTKTYTVMSCINYQYRDVDGENCDRKLRIRSN